MPGQTRARIRSAVDLLRPKTFFRTLSRVDTLVDATRELSSSVEALRIQTGQLMAIQRLDWEKRRDLELLDRELNRRGIEAHISGAVRRATLEHDPFPHVVIDQWLPPDTYRRITDAVPPSVFFADREESKQRLLVPFSFAPEYCRRVWTFVSETIVGEILHRALNDKFRAAIVDYMRSFCPAVSDDFDVTMHTSDGRIMLRRPGYTLAPHRDPKWAFITGLVYLARDGDSEAYGTRLYRVKDDAEAPSDKVYYVEQDRCELVKSVPFRANTLFAFLNSTGAHSASIPADAQPADLERYVYQFRLGPTVADIKRLLALMPPDKAALWSGFKADRAAAY